MHKMALQFRSLLARAEEKDRWLDLMAEAFADKGVPRVFFQRHAEADPHWDPSGVRVCVDNDNRFVSTVRSFAHNPIQHPTLSHEQLAEKNVVTHSLAGCASTQLHHTDRHTPL